MLARLWIAGHGGGQIFAILSGRPSQIGRGS
jgi:hypothetical protein